jgi:hypothetical protein
MPTIAQTNGHATIILTAYYGMAWIVGAYLMSRSDYLPKFLGVLMAIGGTGFVVRNFLLILAPAMNQTWC